MRLPDFLQFTPDERRAALAILLFTGGGGLLIEIGRRHPAWTPDLLTGGRAHHAADSRADSGRVTASLVPASAAEAMAGDPGAASAGPPPGAVDPGAGETAPPPGAVDPGAGETAPPPDVFAPAAGEPGNAAGLTAVTESAGTAAAGDHAPRHRGRAVSKKKTGPAEPFNVNAADSTLLMTLPGIGPAMAGRIIADRGRNGPFRSAEDLMRVKGIGKATAARLKPFLLFGPVRPR